MIDLPVTMRVEIAGGDIAGGNEVVIEAVPLGPITRSLSMQGDPVQIVVRANEWAALHNDDPFSWDRRDGQRRTLRVIESDELGAQTVVLTLAGYVERDAVPAKYGEPLDGSTGAVPDTLLVTLDTWASYFREGRGGTLLERTLNPLGADGRVVAPMPGNDSMTTSDLFSALLAFEGIAFDSIPATVDEAPLPGPLDWGNARITPEQDSLLAYTGHAMAPVLETNDKVVVVRLPKAGETITLPAMITDNAEPYELVDSPSLRATDIAVTSGRTRSIIVRTITLADLEFVGFDDRTGNWLNQSEWTTAYSDDPGPQSLAAFQAGPRTSSVGRAEYRRLYTALRVSDADLRARTRRMIPLPNGTTLASGESAAGVPAVLFAQHALAEAGGQWRNDPETLPATLARVEGVRVDPKAGVFLLPKPMLKVGSAVAGSTDTLVELAPADLEILFAHEANERTATPAGLTAFELNYFGRAFASDDDGVVTPAGMSGSGQDLVDALRDTSTVHVQAPSLREVWLWEDGDAEPTSVNGVALAALAVKHGDLRASAPNATSGTIRLRGLHAVQPGDAGGAVSRVSWDVAGRTTSVSIMQHEAPFSTFDQLERAAGRSIASGLSRFQFSGSSAGESDVREGSSPNLGYGIFATPVPTESNRGTDDAADATAVLAPPVDADVYAPPAMRFGRITASSMLAANRWSYTVRLGHVADDQTFVDGTTDVFALNQRELGNSATGVQGNGIDVANYGGFVMQPAAGVVLLMGEYGAPGARFALFDQYNAVDGTCAP